jgi:hypothetical protein
MAQKTPARRTSAPAKKRTNVQETQDQAQSQDQDTNKGYAGTADNTRTDNRNVDPGQATAEQQKRQERGEPLND